MRIALNRDSIVATMIRMTPRPNPKPKPNDGQPPPSPTEDVVWGQVDLDSYQDMSLVPLDSDAERRRIPTRESLLPVGVVYEEDEVTEPELQFSIRQLMLIQAGVALVLALVRLLAPRLFAGTLGITAMVFAYIIAVHDPDDVRIRRAWWIIFSFYIVACIATFVVAK